MSVIGLNRALVNSLGCMKRDDGGSGLNAIVKMMENAIEVYLSIYKAQYSSCVSECVGPSMRESERCRGENENITECSEISKEHSP